MSLHYDWSWSVIKTILIGPTYLDISIKVITQLREPIFDSAEECVESGEVGQSRPVHEGLQAFAQDTRQVLAQQLPLYRVN